MRKCKALPGVETNLPAVQRRRRTLPEQLLPFCRLNAEGEGGRGKFERSREFVRDDCFLFASSWRARTRLTHCCTAQRRAEPHSTAQDHFPDANQASEIVFFFSFLNRLAASRCPFPPQTSSGCPRRSSLPPSPRMPVQSERLRRGSPFQSRKWPKQQSSSEEAQSLSESRSHSLNSYAFLLLSFRVFSLT